RATLRHRIRALARVDRAVPLGTVAAADAFAYVQHRRLVALALADHDQAVEACFFHRFPSRIDGRLIRLVVVPVAHPVGRGDRGGFGDADELEARRALAWDPLERRSACRGRGLAHGGLTLVRYRGPRTQESLRRALD